MCNMQGPSTCDAHAGFTGTSKDYVSGGLDLLSYNDSAETTFRKSWAKNNDKWFHSEKVLKFELNISAFEVKQYTSNC